MPVRGQRDRSFSQPSPGQILKQRPPRMPTEAPTNDTAAPASVDLARDPFRADIHTTALIERGVLLAPLLVQWHYKVAAARPFAKWLKTKDIILSDARLGIDANTSGVHYFGTYITQSPALADAGIESDAATPGAVACQTLWGFSNEAAMHHMFDLCRGNVERVSIVENDLRDFVFGLKAQIRDAGSHFSQSVLVAPAAL